MRKVRRVWWAGLLVVLLLALTVSGAAAQGITGDKVVFGGNFNLPAGQSLNGKLTVMGGNATLEQDSSVNGDVTILGGTLSAAGHIRGDVAVFGGSVSLEPTAVVEGNINTWGGSVHRAPGAVVRGSTQQGFPGNSPRSFLGPQLTPAMPVPQAPNPRGGPLGFFVAAILRFLGAIGLGLLMALIAVVVVLVAPNATGRVATAFGHQPAVSFAVGLLTLVLASLLGIPLLIACGLGLLVWLLTLVALLFGWIAGGLWLGQRLLGLLKIRTNSSVVEAAVGVFLITWVTWVAPRCIGWLFGLIVGSIGLGAVLLARFGTQPLGGWSRPASAPATGLLGAGAAGQPRAQSAGSAAYAAGAATAQAQPPYEGPSSEAPVVPPVEEAPVSEPVGVSETPAVPVSLQDLEAIRGVTPEIADRLRATGNTTLIAVATSDPQTLSAATGASVEQIMAEDWIGQARRLLG